LAERVMAHRFTAHRLRDAINKVIDNFTYKDLNIADVINFDHRARLYTYNEVCRAVEKQGLTFAHFHKRRINGQLFWILASDITL
jgi:hypothetical protein